MECDDDKDMTRGEAEDDDPEDAGPSAQGRRNHEEDQLKKGLPDISRGAAKGRSGYLGVHKETRKADLWKLYMTLPILSAYREPGQRKSKLKFLGFFPSAEAAGRAHDQVAFHVLGRR